jgi:hypothetical protein
VRNRESSTGDLWVKGCSNAYDEAFIESACIKPVVRAKQRGCISDALVSFV